MERTRGVFLYAADGRFVAAFDRRDADRVDNRHAYLVRPLYRKTAAAASVHTTRRSFVGVLRLVGPFFADVIRAGYFH